jgi:hypothetical protein
VSAPFAETLIRCSALSAYPDCPRRAAARLFRREIEAAGFKLRLLPRSVAAAIGVAVHRAAELTLREKAVSGLLPPASVATDIAHQSLGEAIHEGVQYDGPRGATHTAKEAEGQTLRMSTAYHRVIAPAVQPIVIEERLEAEIAPGLILSGQPDIVAREPEQVRDLKTSARSLGYHRGQIGAYSLLARTHGWNIARAAIDFVKRVRVGTMQPDPESITTDVGLAETAAINVMRHVEQDLATWRFGDPERGLRPGDPWSFLSNPSSMLCSERWCSAWGTDFCREHAPAGGYKADQDE